MNNDVLPTFETHQARFSTVLSDKGASSAVAPTGIPTSCSSSSRTSSTALPRSADPNGFVERLHRTLLDEHFRVLGRTKFYESIQEMQNDLDAYLITYNTKRPIRAAA